MAVYENANTNVHDLKEVNDTLYQILENTKYYFRALSTEDNFTPELYLRYKQIGEKISVMELTEKGLQSSYEDLEAGVSSQTQAFYGEIALKVSKGDVSNQLSLEP